MVVAGKWAELYEQGYPGSLVSNSVAYNPSSTQVHHEAGRVKPGADGDVMLQEIGFSVIVNAGTVVKPQGSLPVGDAMDKVERWPPGLLHHVCPTKDIFHGHASASPPLGKPPSISYSTLKFHNLEGTVTSSQR